MTAPLVEIDISSLEKAFQALSPAHIEQLLIKAVDKTADAVLRDFRRSTKTFAHQPVFHVKRARREGDAIIARVYTEDENYVRLNFGTKPHTVGKGGRLMSFYGFPKTGKGSGKKTYRPKTRPGVIGAVAGGRIPHKKVVRRGPWRQKGIKARHFDESIARKNQPVLEANVRQAIDQYAAGRK